MSNRYVVDFGTQFHRHILEEAAKAIREFSEQRVVEWRLQNLETMPWMDLYFVASVMRALKPVAKEKIKISLIVLPSPWWQTAVDSLFALARPEAPYEIFAGCLPEEMQEEVAEAPRRLTLALAEMAAAARGASGPPGPSV